MDDRHHSILKPASDPSLEMTDSDLFWQDHWKKFVAGLIAVVVLILACGGWMLYTTQQRSSAEALYSLADNVEAWKNVVALYPGSVVAGDARLQIAAALRAKNDLNGAAAELEAFVADQPKHPMAGAAWLALGDLREVEGKADAALECYRNSSSRYKDSYAAPLAMLAEAKVLLAQSRPGEAKSLLESIPPTYPNSPAAAFAQEELARFAQEQAASPAPQAP